MEEMITIYTEKHENGKVFLNGKCPKCEWEVDIPFDGDEGYDEFWLENNKPDFHLGNIISPHHGRLLHEIYECPKCKTIFGVQMTP